MKQDPETLAKIQALLNPAPTETIQEEENASYGSRIYALTLKLDKEIEMQNKRMWVLLALTFVAQFLGVLIILWLGFG